MRSYRVRWAVLLLLGVLGPMVALEQSARVATHPFETPQKVFEEAVRASKQRDFRAYARCLASESQDLLTGQFILTASMVCHPDIPPKNGKRQGTSPLLDRILRRSGLTQERLESISKEHRKKKFQDVNDRTRWLKGLAVEVKDKEGFIADMIYWLEKVGPNAGKGVPLENATLRDIRIQNDRASGVVTTRVGGKAREEPMEFLKVGKGWLIVVPEPKSKLAPVKETATPGKPR